MNTSEGLCWSVTGHWTGSPFRSRMYTHGKGFTWRSIASGDSASGDWPGLLACLAPAPSLRCTSPTPKGSPEALCAPHLVPRPARVGAAQLACARRGGFGLRLSPPWLPWVDSAAANVRSVRCGGEEEALNGSLLRLGPWDTSPTSRSNCCSGRRPLTVTSRGNHRAFPSGATDSGDPLTAGTPLVKRIACPVRAGSGIQEGPRCGDRTPGSFLALGQSSRLRS